MSARRIDRSHPFVRIGQIEYFEGGDVYRL
jgi:hypothetical protein